jgi:hypothetical protein
MKEAIERIDENSPIKPKITVRVNYRTEPNPKTFIENDDMSSDVNPITYFWLESAKSVSNKLSKNTVFISDFFQY